MVRWYSRFQFRYNWKKKFILWHRLSYLLFNWEIEDWLFVCHKCDNPSCVNPEHLFKWTPLDNTLDAKNKWRLKTDHLNKWWANYFRECIAGWIKFKSMSEAWRYFWVVPNTIKNRIKNKNEWYSFL